MSIKKDFVIPIFVLALLCLLISGALAVGNRITHPVIEQAASQRMETARREIIPNADGFELLDMEFFHRDSSVPKTVTAIYKTTNDSGYIFMTTTIGYGGEIKLVCGVDPDGKIIKTAVLSQSETQGFGTPVFDEPHAGQYWGKDRNNIEDIAAISGATISSKAFKKGIRDSLEAFDIVIARQAGIH